MRHYMPMRNAMDMQKQIIDIELALGRARKAAKTDREKLALDPEDQACYKAKTREYTARKDPEIEFRERERPKKADEPTECGENSIEVSNPRDLEAMWRWLSGDDSTSKKRRKKRKSRAYKDAAIVAETTNDPEEYDYDKPTLAETNSASGHCGYDSDKSTLAEAESASD